jgi:hypothetical protein
MDQRREVPGTDAVFADPRLGSAVAVPARATVKGVVALAAGLAEPLRAKAVVGRVARGRLLPDLHCVPPDRDGDVYAAVRDA